jgi:hypothetical protein
MNRKLTSTPRYRQATLGLVLAVLVTACTPSGVPEPEISGDPAPPFVLVRTDLAAFALASAVESAPDHSPELALDGDPETYWQAAGEVPQILEIDLGPAADIGEIRLTLYQPTAGTSLQRIYGKGPFAGDEYRLLHEFSGETADGQELQQVPEAAWAGIRFLRIETVQSPAPFGWREITVLPPGEDPYEASSGDSDGDGLLDLQDWCPDSPGPYETNGC